ncbi:MAG TPA: PA domain-containing protein [Thermoanaerobaculia bacterium]|nr:PA domain-containing protein [Thermoanaerobaculia bacterium]
MRRALLLVVLLLPLQAEAATKITIQIMPGPEGAGFNDPTPGEPVGGNPGTTLGQQRLNAFHHAARIWEQVIDSPVEIQVLASFSPMGDCTETTAVLGAAAAWEKVADFENAPEPGILYPIALANKLAGRDLRLGQPDIRAYFNSAVDTPECLGSRNWYYGLDGNKGNDVDLITVLLHEIGHGLGMSGSMNVRDGAFSGNLPSIFERHALDLSTGLRFDQMSAEQRKAAVVNDNQTVWIGERTREAAARMLAASTTLRITDPAAVAGTYPINPATFGPAVDQTPLAGQIVAALDAADAEGPTTTDGCSPYTNAADMPGRIALVDRGTCTFVIKALLAQAAGAIGIIVANNAPCGFPPMGGGSSEVLIPAVGISKNDGDALRQHLADGVHGSLRLDPSTRAGTSLAGYVRLYVPCSVSPGSSMYHWDVTTTPNLLMEPFISDDLPHGVDITLQQLLDIGWTEPPSGRRILRRR